MYGKLFRYNSKMSNEYKSPSNSSNTYFQTFRLAGSNRNEWEDWVERHKTREFNDDLDQKIDHPIYHSIEHHVSKTSFYSSDLTLNKIRVVMMMILVANWLSTAFVYGVMGFLKSFMFYTIWNETFVVIYFVIVVFAYPVSNKLSNALVAYQHFVIISQTIVVAVFWSILFPAGGLTPKDQPVDWNAVWGNSYKHTVPFFCILHEVLVTYGLYTKKGIYITWSVFTTYLCLNLSLAICFKFLVYPTPFTDAHKLVSYPALLVNVLIIYGVGLLYLKIKRSRTLSHFKREYGMLYDQLERDTAVNLVAQKDGKHFSSASASHSASDTFKGSSA